MCSTGFCAMRLDSFKCTNGNCLRRAYADGRDLGVVIWSASTAATAVILRGNAREVTTSGSTFAACYRHWKNKCVDV